MSVVHGQILKNGLFLPHIILKSDYMLCWIDHNHVGS